MGQLGPDKSEPAQYTCRLYYGFEGIWTLTLLAFAPFLLRANRRRAVVVAVGLFLAAACLAFQGISYVVSDCYTGILPAVMGTSFVLLLVSRELARLRWYLRTPLAYVTTAVLAIGITWGAAPPDFYDPLGPMQFTAGIPLIVLTATIVSMGLLRRRFRIWPLYLLLPVMIWTFLGAFLSVTETVDLDVLAELSVMTGGIYVFSLPALLLVTFSGFFRERFLALFGIPAPDREANEGSQPPGS